MTTSDAPAVAGLTRQLGYEATSAEVAGRYEMLAASAGSIALVAEKDGRLVGWITALDRVLLQEKRVLEIGGLVVDTNRRGEGIGARLVEAIAQWARRNGHTTLFVRSNVKRGGAHDFYPALGFAHQKTSHTYVMELE
jgi:predicted N-acetyltransferase YhbS